MNDSWANSYGLTEAGGKLYFWAAEPDQQINLWVLEDVQSNPRIVNDLRVSRFYDHSMVNVNRELFFAFAYGGNTELWKANESPELAERLTIIPGIQTELLATEDQIFMGGDELWRSDGTAEGTYSLSHAYPGTEFGEFNVADDKLFFLGDSSDTGEELWVSDGTISGTHLVKDIVPGWQGCSLADMVAIDDTLFFAATVEDGKQGLWKSDGTEQGTVPIIQMDTLAYGSEISPISSGDGVVYFHGYDPSSGSELWKSDGTEEGTVLVADINAGPDDSRKYRTKGTAAEINGHLYFAADDGFHGYEIWKVPLEPVNTVSAWRRESRWRVRFI